MSELQEYNSIIEFIGGKSKYDRIIKVGKRPLRASSPSTNPTLPGPSLSHVPKHDIYT